MLSLYKLYNVGITTEKLAELLLATEILINHFHKKGNQNL